MEDKSTVVNEATNETENKAVNKIINRIAEEMVKTADKSEVKWKVENNYKLCHLHNHTEMSQLRMLDCIIKVKDLIKDAVKRKFGGVAITDHETVAAYVDALKCYKELKGKGEVPDNFKLILGNEIYLVDEVFEEVGEMGEVKKYITTPHYHFILLAKDEIGCKQLRELSTLAWGNYFKTGKIERVPTVKKDLERVIKGDKGHLIAQTACLSGELPKMILEKFDGDEDSLNYVTEKEEEFILWLRGLFGEDLYFELQPAEGLEQYVVNTGLLKLAKYYGIKCVVTCDTHYLHEKDRLIHKAYLNSREEERETDDFYKYTYMMDADEVMWYMKGLYGEDVVEELMKNTLEVRDKVEEYDVERGTIVPKSDLPEFEVMHLFQSFYDEYEYLKKYAYSENAYDRYLLKLVEEGFLKKEKYEEMSDKELEDCIERIEIEFKEMWLVTEKLNESISSYYISTLELIDIMWNEGDSLVGVARGSVTGMYTMYLINLIQMNPMKWGLPHWRHISHEKIELSDVDIDSQANRRGKIIEAVKKKKGERRVLNCCTYKTEGSKSAIKTAGKGLGYSSDAMAHIAGMIPITRGFNWTLKDCVYGNEEEDRKPLTEFINECNKYEGLLETALKIEGLICGRSIHASAVYIFNNDFIEQNARMCAPNGVSTTQYNMKASDYMGGLKMDFLTVKNLDKIRLCMDMLIKAGKMEWKGSLRETYNTYLHPDVIDYDTEEMWDWIGENKVTDLFQYDTPVGIQAAKKIKPHSLDELATANSVMRLMVSEKNAEQPIDTFIRYKNDINEWYKDMKRYNLTDDEVKLMEKYLMSSNGVGATQEDVMQISMDEGVAGFNVRESNKLRKGIAKKDKELQKKMRDELFEFGEKRGASKNLLNYVWKEVVGKQLGYSFSKNHTYPYSVIGLQDLNLAYHYPIVYWNCACLTVNADANSDDVEDGKKGGAKSGEYGRIATAIANMQKNGMNVSYPTVNEAGLGFLPDEENNQIIFGLKGIAGLGESVAKEIIANAPYTSFDDFYERMVVTKIVSNVRMIKLIKAGAFKLLEGCSDVRDTMYRYFEKSVKQIDRLGLSQLNNIIELGLLPEDMKGYAMAIEFKKVVIQDDNLIKHIIVEGKKLPKCGYHDRVFSIPEGEWREVYEELVREGVVEECVSIAPYLISEKRLEKALKKSLTPFREWLGKDDVVKMYNNALVMREIEEKASGSISKWEMDSMCFYKSEHELEGVDEEGYGVENFFDLPEEPEAYDHYSRWIDGEQKWVPKYRISRIAGTVLDNDNGKHMITLLTKYGVVKVKMSAGQYSNYNKQISIVDESGKSKIVEKSWFKRGNLIICTGYRRDDTFRCYRYADTIYPHTVGKINEVVGDRMIIETERWTEKYTEKYTAKESEE